MITYWLNKLKMCSNKRKGIIIIAFAVMLSLLNFYNVEVFAAKNADGVPPGMDIPELIVGVDPINPDGLDGKYFKVPVITLAKTSDDTGTIYYKWDNGSEQIYQSPIKAPSGRHRLTTFIRQGLTDRSTVQKTFDVNPHQRLSKISTGLDSTLLVKEDGTVWGWGYNYYGNLGNGTVSLGNELDIPSQILGLQDIVEVGSGYYHSLALKSDGTVWAWGSCWEWGLLGDGRTDKSVSYAPMQISGLTDIVDISVGPQNSLALKSDGTVWAWGNNSYGQLGDGTNQNRSVPVQVGGLSEVSAVSCGDSHSLALKSDGTVYAWGDNSYGQLGISSYTPNVLNPTKIRQMYTSASGWIGSFEDITAIACGSRHSLALKSDGTVYTWGSNQDNKLGVGSQVQSSERIVTPRQVVDLSGIRGIYGGGERSMALKSDGSLWSWGINWNGQLGDGTKEIRDTPVMIPQISSLTAVSAGPNHTVIMKSDSSVWAWGKNDKWQLGSRSSIEDRVIPVQVDFSAFVIPPMENSRIAVSDTASLYIKSDGTLLQWGNSTLQKNNITMLGGVISIAGGKEHFLALNSDGTVWAWGDNTYGQLGNGTSDDHEDPVQVSGLTNITGIASGEYHCMALKSDGTVWTWGLNEGRLGDGVTQNRSTPVQVSGISYVVAIAGGGDHSLALKSNGEVWGWGKNDLGQIKVDPGQYQHTDTQTRNTPVKIENINYVTSIACGKSHSIAMRCDGTVYAWGDNTYGQCGTNSGGKPIYLIRIAERKEVEYQGYPVTMGVPISDTSSIACGESHSMVVRANGSVWSWGNNEGGQLGIGATEYVDDNYKYNIYSPQEIAGLSSVHDIAGTTNHSIAVKGDGALWAWGYNQSRQLGDGTSTDKYTPVYIDVLAPQWEENNGINVNKESDGRLALLWTSAYDDVGISEYTVNIYDESDSLIGTYNSINSSINIEGLNAGVNYKVEISAVDHSGNISAGLIGQAFIEGTGENQSPSIQLNTVVEVLASDPDGDAVNISLGDDAPSFVKLVGNKLVFEPTTERGTYTFSVHVEDGRGGKDTQTITITRFGINNPVVPGSAAPTTNIR